jgi:hypothetical protein
MNQPSLFSDDVDPEPDGRIPPQPGNSPPQPEPQNPSAKKSEPKRRKRTQEDDKAKDEQPHPDRLEAWTWGWLFAILKRANEALPATKLLWMLAGILSILGFFKAVLSEGTGVIGVVLILFSLPFVILIVAADKEAKRAASGGFGVLSLRFSYAIAILYLAVGSLTVSSVYFGWPRHLESWIPSREPIHEPIANGETVPVTIKFATRTLEEVRGDAFANNTERWLPWILKGVAIRQGQALLVLESTFSSPRNYQNFTARIWFEQNERFELLEGSAFVRSIPDPETKIRTYKPVEFVIQPDADNTNHLSVPKTLKGETLLIIVRVGNRDLTEKVPTKPETYRITIRTGP